MKISKSTRARAVLLAIVLLNSAQIWAQEGKIGSPEDSLRRCVGESAALIQFLSATEQFEAAITSYASKTSDALELLDATKKYYQSLKELVVNDDVKAAMWQYLDEYVLPEWKRTTPDGWDESLWSIKNEIGVMRDILEYLTPSNVKLITANLQMTQGFFGVSENFRQKRMDRWRETTYKMFYIRLLYENHFPSPIDDGFEHSWPTTVDY